MDPAISSYIHAGASRGQNGGMMTELEIEEAIREAWKVLHAGATASPAARRLAAALLAVTGATPAQPSWVTPDDLWRDRLALLAEHGLWLTAWGPRLGEPGCRVPRALRPDTQAMRENAYTRWRSEARDTAPPPRQTGTPPHPPARGQRSRRQNRAEEITVTPAQVKKPKPSRPTKE
jgi:hypothetical protein